ncbi:L-rhamnose mutarotase [Algoriphagus sp. NG3]|uniref:L-rhamnose mutarotase n=1 Tax=Algoriphagus sp. NG3 TaxID=3097546 RepID=UPI002A832792|nr:L-rhamnose mutarotase [Algoriphagus sp. NG3]WPR73339.1 L-rhamnose mutarotase [Algoriphagus sp. NG3]
MKYKRYCKQLSLKDEPELIARYKEAHGMGNAWPEITAGMKEIGILDMEIYILGNTLFMIMDTIADFDHDDAMQKLSKLPRQKEWENYVAEFQQTDESASADQKWQLMERIYEMDQSAVYDASSGQIKSLLEDRE